MTKDIVGSSCIVLLSPATSSHTTPCSVHSLRAIYLNVAPSESESDAEYTLGVATPTRRQRLVVVATLSVYSASDSDSEGKTLR